MSKIELDWTQNVKSYTGLFVTKKYLQCNFSSSNYPQNTDSY